MSRVPFSARKPSRQQAEDTLLAIDCQLGGAVAWKKLLRRFGPPLRYYLGRTVGETAAHDVLQEVWLKAFKTIHHLEKPEAIRSWLYQVAHGVMVDFLRKQGRLVDEVVPEALEDVEGPGGHEEEGLDAFDVSAIHEALLALSLSHREVLLLYFLEDMGIAEMARVIGVPAGTVKSRLHHAKWALRPILTRMGYDKTDT